MEFEQLIDFIITQKNTICLDKILFELKKKNLHEEVLLRTTNKLTINNKIIHIIMLIVLTLYKLFFLF